MRAPMRSLLRTHNGHQRNNLRLLPHLLVNLNGGFCPMLIKRMIILNTRQNLLRITLTRLNQPKRRTRLSRPFPSELLPIEVIMKMSSLCPVRYEWEPIICVTSLFRVSLRKQDIVPCVFFVVGIAGLNLGAGEDRVVDYGEDLYSRVFDYSVVDFVGCVDVFVVEADFVFILLEVAGAVELVGFYWGGHCCSLVWWWLGVGDCGWWLWLVMSDDRCRSGVGMSPFFISFRRFGILY